MTSCRLLLWFALGVGIGIVAGAVIILFYLSVAMTFYPMIG